MSRPAPAPAKRWPICFRLIFSNKRVIISTATKNLQEQLFFKDIPFLEKALGRKLSVCYMKGRSNYLCWNRLEEIEGEAYLFSPHDPEYLRLIKKWAQKTETGDRAELTELPDDMLLWHHLDARRETCTGQKCRNFDACFVTRVRQQALESDIIIVNHHLFFADLALRQGDFGSVLPDYSVLVFDEAHEIEDVATQYFGVMVSNYGSKNSCATPTGCLTETGASSAFLIRSDGKSWRSAPGSSLRTFPEQGRALCAAAAWIRAAAFAAGPSRHRQLSVTPIGRCACSWMCSGPRSAMSRFRATALKPWRAEAWRWQTTWRQSWNPSPGNTCTGARSAAAASFSGRPPSIFPPFSETGFFQRRHPQS